MLCVGLCFAAGSASAADVPGSLTIDGSPLAMTITQSGDQARLSFDGTAGQKVGLGVRPGTLSTASLGVHVYKPDGALVPGVTWSTNNCTVSNKGCGFDFALPDTGTYNIVIKPVSNGTGSFTTTLSLPAQGTLSANTAAPLSTRAGQNAEYSFTGTAGDQLGVTLQNAVYVDATSGVVSVLNPDGSVLASYTASAGLSSLDLPALPVSGAYKVVLNPAYAATLSADLTLTADIIVPIVLDGASVSGTVALPGQTARLVFSGTAGQQVGLGISPITSSSNYHGIYVYQPDGSLVSGPSWTVSNCNVAYGGCGFDFTLAATGDYTVLVKPRTNATGTFTARISQPASATLAPNISHSISTLPGQDALLSFTGVAGDQLGITMQNTAYANASDGTLKILKPDGSVLLTYNPGPGLSSRDIPALPVSGTYKVHINPNHAGTVTSDVILTADVMGSLVLDGPASSGTITLPGQMARLVFSGTAGQRVGLGISSITSTSSSLGIYVYQPDGTLVSGPSWSSTNCSVSNGCGFDFTLAVTGDHTVLVTPSSNATSSFTARISQPLSGTLALDTPQNISTVSGQDVELSFAGTAGDQLGVTLQNAAYVGASAGKLSVLKPDGSVLVTYNPGAGLSSVDVPVLPVSGTYKVVVGAAYAGSLTATVTLTTDVVSTLLVDGASQSGVIDFPGRSARLTFEGTVGQKLGLGISPLASSSGYAAVNIYKPDGSSYLSDTDCSVATQGCAFDMTLPSSGTYNVVIKPTQNGTGSFTAALSQPLSATLTANAAPASFSLRVGQTLEYSFTGVAGDQFGVTLQDAAFSGADRATLRVLKPDGSQLATRTSLAGLSSLDMTALPVSGNYTVTINPNYAGSMTGSLILTSDVVSTLTLDGPSVPGVVEVPGQTARLVFSGTAGQHIGLALSSITSTSNYLGLYVYHPGSTTPASGHSQDCYVPRGCDRDFTLPVTGDYHFVVVPKDNATGSFVATLTSDITDGTAANTDFPVTLRPGQNARMTFSGTAGQSFRLTTKNVAITGGNQEGTMYLYRPDGTQLSSKVFINGGPTNLNVASLPVTGTYTALVDLDYAGSATMTLNLSANLQVPIEVDGAPVAINFSSPGQTVQLQFAGTAGQYLGLGFNGMSLMDGSNQGSMVVAVYRPDGSLYDSVNCSTYHGGCSEALAALPVSGTYSIMATAGSQSVGAVTAFLSSYVQATLDASPLPVSLRSGQSARLTLAGTQGQQRVIRVSSPAFAGSNISQNGLARLLNPSGSQVGSFAIPAGGDVLLSLPVFAVSGNYTLELSAPYGASATFSVLQFIDTTAPTVTSVSAAQLSGTSKLRLTVAAADSESGIDHYDYQLATDAAFTTGLETVTGGSTPLTTADLPAGTYYVRVRAVDVAGNTSAYIPASGPAMVIVAPVAAFSASQVSGEAPFSVAFTNATTGTVSSYSWNFGSGQTSSAQVSPTHVYRTPGTYSVTVTASGPGGTSTSAAQTITVTADLTAPSFSGWRLNGTPVTGNVLITKAATLGAVVADADAVSSVACGLDGASLTPLMKVGSVWNLAINPLELTEGPHQLACEARDASNNVGSLSQAVTVQLALPDAPSMSAPLANKRFSSATLTLAGTAEPGATIVADINGALSPATATATASGQYSLALPVPDGALALRVAAVNRTGQGAWSAARNVLVDSTMPRAPTAVSAVAQPAGKVRLTWVPSSDPSVVGYHVYRAANAFADVATAVRVNAIPVTTSIFDDMPDTDGRYYYSVVAVNSVGTLSLLPEVMAAVADNTAPRALSIAYQPSLVDGEGRSGQGSVAITLTVSEPLQTTPYLAMVPAGSAPVVIDLLRRSDTEYEGIFVVTGATGTGVAHALFSVRDVVGNRGTVIDSGATLTLDTEGPVLQGIQINPGAPIKNDPAQSVAVTFTFTEPVKAGTEPLVEWQLSGPLRAAQPLALTAVNATTWAGTVVLPADAGLASPESLSFSYSASDALDNFASRITAPNAVQVYQGGLPALFQPFGLVAKAEKAGKVQLNWQTVEGAAEYQLYRRAPGESALTPLARATTNAYLDQAAVDGLHEYAVASVRSSNGQESLSSQTEPVSTLASASAPGSPQNLQLQLSGQGVAVSWQPPLTGSVSSYRLYRATGSVIESLSGLLPLRTGITQTTVVDAQPSATEHAYVVTALDEAGNESALSNSAYLNATLLPVKTLKAEQRNNGLPLLSWTASPSVVAGYHVYVGEGAGKVRLTASPVTGLSYTDTGYTQGRRVYTVAAVDPEGVEIGRELVLPAMNAQVASGLPLKRGIMNRLSVQVSNTSTATIAGARLRVRVGNHEHTSDVFGLAASETRLVPVIIGGYADLPASAPAEVVLEVQPHEGEQALLATDSTFDVTEGALLIGIATENFTRGGSGLVRLAIENTSDVEVELLTATHTGSADSSELRFKLLDTDGNLLLVQPYRQALGTQVVTLPNGDTVARIPAGATFLSAPFSLSIPASAPERVRVKLEVDTLRYHTGQADEVRVVGRSAEAVALLVDTSYTALVTAVTPAVSFGDEEIMITGHAVERDGEERVPYARVNLLLNQQGFQRIFSVMTDAAGAFTFNYSPGLADAGVIQVAAVHPDISDRPLQQSFTINRVVLGPTPYKLTVSRNYAFDIPFTVKAGNGTSATHVHFVADSVPAGVQLTLPAAVSLAASQTLNIPVRFSADNTVAATGSLTLKAYSTERGTTPIGEVVVNFTLTDAKPNLVASPNFVEAGLAMGNAVVETVTIENKGTQDALNLQFQLVQPDGSPAPAWAALASQADGKLAVGESRMLDLSFTPPASTPAGVYEFRLAMQGVNVPAQSVNVFVSVTQSGTGNVLFKASDIYTATLDANGQLIQGLAGARIVVQNEDVASVLHEVVSDTAGEALLQDLPVGYYKFKASASRHQERNGRFQIKPGLVHNQSVFLEYRTVTIEWSVREVAVEDRYEIVANATFETDVPTAVVVAEPPATNLPAMSPGEVYYGEFTLTNYGLVRADNVIASLPKDDAYFRYEFMVSIPDTLDAKTRLVVPYRMVSLSSLENAGEASGAGCNGYGAKASFSYTSECANGAQSNGSAGLSINSNSSSNCGGNFAFGNGGEGGGGGGGKASSGTSSPAGESIGDSPCSEPDADNDDDDCD